MENTDIKTAVEMYGNNIKCFEDSSNQIALEKSSNRLRSMGLDDMDTSTREERNSYVIKITADGEFKRLQIRDCSNILNALDMLGVLDKAGSYHNPLSDYPHPKVKVKVYRNFGEELSGDKSKRVEKVVDAERDYTTDLSVYCNRLLAEKPDAYNYMASKLLGESVSGDVIICTQMYDQNGDLSPRGFEGHKNAEEIRLIVQDMVENGKTLEKIEEKKPTRADNLRPTEFRLGNSH